MRRTLARAIAKAAALALTVSLAACGGGGPDAGTCVFAPQDCRPSQPLPPVPPGPFSLTATGDFVFTLPPRAANYAIAAATDQQGQFFRVLVDGALRINVVIGTNLNPPTYSGILRLPASGLVEVRDSAGVSWSIRELP